MRYFIGSVVISILAILSLLITLIARNNAKSVSPVLLQQKIDISSLKTGDILLCRCTDAIEFRKSFTASNFTHTAMIYRSDRQVYVVELRANSRNHIHIIPFEKYNQKWRNIYEVFAVRRLKHELSAEKLKPLYENIVGLQKLNQRTYLKMAQSIGIVMMDWIYNQVCLQDRSFFRNLNDSYYICTDLIAFLFLRSHIFHSRPVIITPELFATDQIYRFSNVEWDPVLYIINK